MADYSVEILALEALLNSGQSTVTVDGMTSTVDLAEVRRRLTELRRLDDDSIADGRSKPNLVPYRFCGGSG